MNAAEMVLRQYYVFFKGAALISFVLAIVEFYFYPRIWFFLVMYIVNGAVLTFCARRIDLLNGLICIIGKKL